MGFPYFEKLSYLRITRPERGDERSAIPPSLRHPRVGAGLWFIKSRAVRIWQVAVTESKFGQITAVTDRVAVRPRGPGNDGDPKPKVQRHLAVEVLGCRLTRDLRIVALKDR